MSVGKEVSGVVRWKKFKKAIATAVTAGLTVVAIKIGADPALAATVGGIVATVLVERLRNALDQV